MKKVLIILIIMIMPLIGNENFSDKDMKINVLNIVKNKQKVYTALELVEYLFSIKKRGEFELKTEYKERVSKKLNKDGIYYLVKNIKDMEYDIDSKKMSFNMYIGYALQERQKPNLYKRMQGYTEIVYALDIFRKQIDLKKRIEQTNNTADYGDKVHIRMSVKEAKEIKRNKKNFYQIVAVKINADDILNRSIKNLSSRKGEKPYLALWTEVPCKIIGRAIASNSPKKILFAFGKDN